jgi:hypothetical protein
VAHSAETGFCCIEAVLSVSLAMNAQRSAAAQPQSRVADGTEKRSFSANRAAEPQSRIVSAMIERRGAVASIVGDDRFSLLIQNPQSECFYFALSGLPIICPSFLGALPQAM